MKLKAIIPRELANRDVEQAIEHYPTEASTPTAAGFIDALERAYGHIARRPSSGSPRYAHELGLPGLRSWPLRRYPYLVFYIEREQHIDVWRVLHDQRDIPGWMCGNP